MGLKSNAVYQSVICVLYCYFTTEYYLCHTPMNMFVGQHGECIAQALHNFVLHVELLCPPHRILDDKK